MTTPNSESIKSVITGLRYARTITARVDILKKHESDLLKKVMEYALSPYIRFGITINPSQNSTLHGRALLGVGLDITDPDIWATLDNLRTSTASAGAKYAQLETLFGRLSRETSYIVLGILSKTFAGTNTSASTINKVWPGTIPVFSVQLAQKYTDRKIKSFPAYAEIKYDGVRATGVIYPTGDVEVMTRTGRPIPAAKYFHQELRAIGKAYAAVVDMPAGRIYKGCVTDGEVINGESFNDSVSTFRSDEVATSGHYAIFDILPMAALANPAFVSDDFEQRRETLKLVMDYAAEQGRINFAPLDKVLRSESYAVNSREEIWNYYTTARENNLEGIIVKDPKGKWQPKRSNAWLKIKAEETADLRIIGAFEGTGEKAGTLGGLIVDLNGVEVRVGSGYTDEVSDELWAMFLRDLARIDAGSDDYELLGYLAEVQYQEITPAGSLRHPVFRRLRKDKDEVSY